MASITLTIETTDQQDQALKWLFTKRNMEREAKSEKPWPDVSDMLAGLLWTMIDEQYRPQFLAAGQFMVEDALRRATSDEWAKVCDVLQIKMP